MSDQTESSCPGPPKSAEYFLLLAKQKRQVGQISSAAESVAEAQAVIDQASEADWAAAHEKAKRSKE
eukprot:scaffold119228_cov21-Tisochrysis_lutea.AAC.1